MIAAATIASSTYVVPQEGRMTVSCNVENFVASGLSIAEMVNRIRSELVTAATEAAALDRAPKDGAVVRVGIDMDDPDPWFSFTILNPQKFLADLDEQFSRLQRIAARLIATNRPNVKSKKGGAA